MKLDEFGVGKIVKGVNTTQDVGVNQTEKEAKKFFGGNGKPKLLHKTAAKNSNPNTLMNLGIGESVQLDEVLKRVNGRWALVSKTNPKKVLQYYRGPSDQKPSKEWVASVERRVHAFEAQKGITDPLVAEFLQSTGGKYGKRDMCGPACLDFISWARREKGIELKRMRGEFVADEVVSAKADFTPEMKQEFSKSGLDWNSAKDRKAWIEQSKYAEEWKRMPHYWTVDKDGNIHDPSGYQQLVKTGLASDLDPSRYIPEGVNEADEVIPMLYHATYGPFLDSIMKNGLGGKGAQTQWEDSKPGYVYLAKDPEVAYSHAEANEEVPDEYIDDIVVLSIDTSQLDQDNLEDDPNVMDDDSTLAYKGIIPTSAFSVMESLQELRIEKPDPKDTLGIERKFMPQIKSDDYAEFIEFLTKNGVKFRQETIPARDLKAMQKEFSDKGILKQLERNIVQGPNTKAVIASSDDYILDGHHRWLVAVNTGDDLNVYRVNMPAWKLYDLVNKFQKVYYKDIYDSIEERASIGVPLASGLVVSIFPHRPLKIKKSTPGKLNYNEDNPITNIYNKVVSDFEKRKAAFGGNKQPAPNRYNPVPKKQQGMLDKVKSWFTDDINEAYMLRLENTDDQLVLHVKNTNTGERMEVRGKPNYEIDYDPDDELHQLLDVIGKASNISELMNGEVVNVNPKHPDGPKSYKALHDLMNEDLRDWFKEKWVNIGKKDKSGKHPPCGTSGKKSGYAKCVPAAKAAKMSKKEKESATRRKRAAQNKAGRGGTDKPGSGKKPIMVSTKAKESIREEAQVDEGVNDKVYELLLDNIGAGPFDGGCVVVAQALQKIHGGELMALVRNDGTADHAVVQKGNTMYDFDGPGTPEEVVSRFEKNEGTRIAEVRKLRMTDLPDAPRNSELAKQIASLMKESVQEAKVDEGVNDPHIFKAVFLAGGPGSGKSFVAQALLGGTGLKTVNSDDMFEFLMKKQDLALDPETIGSPQGQETRVKARRLTSTRMDVFIDGRLGLLIDGTGQDFKKYEKLTSQFRQLGYDCAMIFVNTSEEVAQQRNQQRARKLPRDMVTQILSNTQDNLMKFQQLMGAGRFHIIDNSGGLEDLDRQKNFDKAYNELQRFLNTPPSKRAALAWIQQQKAQNDGTQRSEREQPNQQSNGGTTNSN